MMEVRENHVLYAVYDSIDSIEQADEGRSLEGSIWYGNGSEPLQASLMNYHAGKEFKIHRHKLNSRQISHTQEALICIKGKAEVEVLNLTKEKLATIVLKPGDIVLLYRGYHGLNILHDNTVLYELKCGSFSSVEVDKEFLNG